MLNNYTPLQNTQCKRLLFSPLNECVYFLYTCCIYIHFFHLLILKSSRITFAAY